MPAGTVFQAGSISKPVAAATVLALADEGVVDLDEPVSTYLTSWRLPADSPDPDGVTLRALLSRQAAGIDTPGYLGTDRAAATTSESLKAGPCARARTRGNFQYSGGGYLIAQQVVEDVTGEPFADVGVSREVLDPLGMSASGSSTSRLP